VFLGGVESGWRDTGCQLKTAGMTDGQGDTQSLMPAKTAGTTKKVSHAVACLA